MGSYVFIAIILCAFAALYAIRRTGWLSALSAFALFNTLCLFYFYYVANLGIEPELRYSVMPIEGIEPYSIEVANFFLMLNGVTAFTVATLPRLAPVKIASLMDQFRRLFSTPAILCVAIPVAVLTIIHMIDFDLSYLWSYTGYHAINELRDVGISNPFAAFYHRLGPTLGAVCAILAVVAFDTRRKFLGLFLTALALYGLLLVLASSSREAAVIMGLPSLVHIVFRRRLDLLSLIGLVLAVAFLIFAVTGRGQTSEQGLAHLPDRFVEIFSEDFLKLPIALMSNIAQGAVNFAHGIRLAPSYPGDFIYFSLYSPLPGDLDGFDQVASAYQVKITVSNPLSAFAEIYHFGAVHTAFILLFIMAVMRINVIQMAKSPDLFRTAQFGLILLLIFRLHQYPTRISNRLMIIIVALMVAGKLWDMAHKSKRRRLPGVVGAESVRFS